MLCHLTIFKSKYWQNNLGDPIFVKACFVLDTTEHIICKNGEFGISCNIDMSERVLYVGPGWKYAKKNSKSFPISGNAKLL